MFKYVLDYDLNAIDIDELLSLHEYLSNKYGEDAVLFIPNEFTFRQFDLKEMKQIRDKMTEIIEETVYENHKTTKYREDSESGS